MSKNTWPISIRYTLKKQSSLDLPLKARWDTYGFVLRDGDEQEHHFGLPEHVGSRVVFTWIASYSNQGREDWPGGVHDKLSSGSYQVVNPTIGPLLSDVVKVALEDVAEHASGKGFAFDDERQRAVRAFLALRRAGEDFDPAEVFVLGATNGLRRPKDAQMFKEYAQRALSGKGTRTVNGYAIKLDPAMADNMIAHWREKTAKK